MKRKIIYIITILASFTIGFFTDQMKQGKKYFCLEELNIKKSTIIKIYDLWMQQKSKSLSIFFERNGFSKIAVYGMGDLGKRVIDELRGTKVVVAYGIDKNVRNINSDIEVVSPDNLKEVDAIIVTPVFYFDEIEKLLMSKVSCPIISLEDVIGNL